MEREKKGINNSFSHNKKQNKTIACGMLPEGIPIAEDVETGKHIFFKYHLDVKRRLGFTLTPITSGGE